MAAVEDRGRVFGYLGGREAEAASERGVDLEVGGRAAEGIVDAVLRVDDAGNLRDGGLLPWARAGAAAAPSLEKSLIWIGSGALERSLMLSCRTCVNSTSSSGSVFDLLAYVGHHVVDGTRSVWLQPDSEVAVVSFRDRGESQLKPGAT